MREEITRRGFLKAVAGSAALLALKRIGEGRGSDQALAADNPSAGHRFFDEHEWATMEALTSQIIPTDQDPGAREAGVVNYIDIALATVYSSQQEMYRKGIKGVDESARAMFKKRNFLDLTPEEQIRLMEAMEKDEVPGKTWEELPASTFFYDCLLTHTYEGFYSDPRYGGNKDYVGWKLVGFPGPSQPRGYIPPFAKRTEMD